MPALSQIPISELAPGLNRDRYQALAESLVTDQLAAQGLFTGAARTLADVDDLMRFREDDGVYEPQAEVEVLQNMVTGVKEGVMPCALSEVEQQIVAVGNAERRQYAAKSLGRFVTEIAARGATSYLSPQGRARGIVEIKHALHNQEVLGPGIAGVKVAPRMTTKDAPLHVAKAEGLAETDSIQVYTLGLDDKKQPSTANIASILVPGIPIDAWYGMMSDPDNIFGEVVDFEGERTALNFMDQAYEAMILPESELREGPISIVVSVLEYINDPAAYKKVKDFIAEYRASNQEQLHKRALNSSERSLFFAKEVGDSLVDGYASNTLHNFIHSLKGRWGTADQKIIQNHLLEDGRYLMTRDLAEIVVKAQQNFALTAAAVVTGNTAVLSQMPISVSRAIYAHEISMHHTNHHMVFAASNANNNLIASQNVRVGGGCTPVIKTNFLTGEPADGDGAIGQDIETGPQDSRGPLNFKCQNGHLNTRERDGELIPSCSTCKVDVSCGRSSKHTSPAPKEQKAPPAGLFAKTKAYNKPKDIWAKLALAA